LPRRNRSVDSIIPPIASRDDGVLHLLGRRLAPESYPLFSQRVVAEVRFGVAGANGTKRGIRFCQIDPRELRLSTLCHLMGQDFDRFLDGSTSTNRGRARFWVDQRFTLFPHSCLFTVE